MTRPTPSAAARTRADRCPGLLRPWPAADGALTRIRLVGGRLTVAQLRGLSHLATDLGDGDVHLTARANVQLRALPADGDRLRAEVVDRVAGLGLLPSPAHDLVRNVMVSPATGLAGGRADLRPVAAALDTALLGEPALAALPGRFLLVLDDGRGDLLDRECDLGLIALDAGTAQLRVGAGWGATVPLAEAPAHLVALARRFLAVRGEGPSAAWHVRELPEPLAEPQPRDPRTHVRTPPLPPGRGPAGRHVVAPDGRLTPDAVARVTAGLPDEHPLVVTPWRGVLVPRPTPTTPSPTEEPHP